MENYWKWLKQANARAVFFCLLAALMIVAGWWAWKLTTPIRMLPPPAPGKTHNPTNSSLGILTFINAQQAAGTNRAANLFTPAESLTSASSSSKTKDSSQPAPEPRKTPPVQPAPARPRDVVTLTYRGLVVRGDGIPMALIADSKSRRTAFYTADTNLFGLTFTNITSEAIGVNSPDQPCVIIKRGVPQSFTEGRHAD